ncbi:MAG: T9SS type A sorting domain-containing protein [Bacteroidia bacterium]|nr:T9SS type A sorting domain-containing protein [Bacteroidia bacterium]
MKTNYKNWNRKTWFGPLVLLLLLSSGSTGLRAQDFEVSLGNDVYRETTGMTKLDIYDTTTTELKADINETFNIFGNNVKIGDEGNEVFLSKGGVIRTYFNGGQDLYTIMGFGILGTRFVGKSDGSSEIAYKVENNFFIAQYKNVGIKTGTDSEYANFKIVIDMSTGSFLFHYGDVNISEATYGKYTGPSVGYRLLEDFQVSTFGGLKGTFESPEIAQELGDQMVGSPENGRIIQFTSTATASTPVLTQDLSSTVYPNPAKDFVHLDRGVDVDVHESGEIKILNAQGQQVASQAFTGSTIERVDVRDLPAGNYLIQVEVNGTVESRSRLMKL